MVDRERCQWLGRFLGELRFPEARIIDAPGDLHSPDLRMLLFIVVAICHQTSPVGKPRLEGMVNGVFRYGWDYLREKWLDAVRADPYILGREWLVTAEAGDVVTILHDRERGSTISDPKGRAELLRDIGVKMYKDGVRHVDEYYDKSGGWLKDRVGREGLESMLSRFDAYGRDPVKKKLSLFLILMRRYGFWDYPDIKNLGGPVDYHEIRLHLRLGTVRIIDPRLREKIYSGSVLTEEEDIAIRLAVHGAISEIAAASGRTPADVHNLDWNIARNCCRRDETHCLRCGEHPSLPPGYLDLLPRVPHEGRSCVFADYCASRALPHSEKPKEPVVDTDLY
ncbi:MAG: hypothetical protein HYW90_05230 [Candidatus Sungbacteria bacterium]|nr:hypothetical protein [Candidatus Sungbacteria bacterium]